MARGVAAALIGTTLALVLPAEAQLRVKDADLPPNLTSFHIKPSGVPIPAGAKPGEIRRMIQPFAAWTLICDENLKARTRVCNVAQTLVDEAGHVVFSWSLAATAAGAPVFIVRAPVVGQANPSVTIDFGYGVAPVAVAMTSCDTSLCLGLIPATPAIRRRIAGGGKVHVGITSGSTPPTTLRTTLDGLAAAVTSIK